MLESDESFTCDKNENINSKARELSIIDQVQLYMRDVADEELNIDSTLKTIKNIIDKISTTEKRVARKMKHFNEDCEKKCWKAPRELRSPGV